MKRHMLKVLYYTRERYNFKRHIEIMSHEKYTDLCLDEDVIIKRKWHIE